MRIHDSKCSPFFSYLFILLQYSIIDDEWNMLRWLQSKSPRMIIMEIDIYHLIIKRNWSRIEKYTVEIESSIYYLCIINICFLFHYITNISIDYSNKYNSFLLDVFFLFIFIKPYWTDFQILILFDIESSVLIQISKQ